MGTAPPGRLNKNIKLTVCYLLVSIQKSLPLLRTAMTRGSMSIEGVRPPPTHLVSSQQPTSTHISQPVTTQTVVTQQVITASGTLTTRPIPPTAQPQVAGFITMLLEIKAVCCI